VRPKTKLFAANFRSILDVLYLQGLQKKVLGGMSAYMCPKTKRFAVTFRRILDVFALQGCRKSSGRIFLIFASKNEAVCRGIQTHFGRSLPVSFTEKVLGTISRFVLPKTKLFEVKFRRIFKVLRLQVLKKKF